MLRSKPVMHYSFIQILLHRSEANTSDTARWSLISVYNRAAIFLITSHHNQHSPVEIVPDEACLNGYRIY
jgi:hypothetical protein